MNVIRTAASTPATTQNTTDTTQKASKTSFADTLAAQQSAETISKVVNTQLNGMLTKSLFGDGSTDGASSGSSNTMMMLLMLCSVLQNGDGDANSLISQLLPALSGMGTDQTNTLYNQVMDTSYDTKVLDKVGTSVFNKTTVAGVPLAQSRPANPALTGNVYNRSAAQYNAVIDQFHVETNGRYQVSATGGTYCNIFNWDVTRAMGAEIPHYTDYKTGAPLQYPDVKGANYMNANETYTWLHQYGAQYGWHEVTPEQAQALANEGHPAVTSYYNGGGHGHLQVVRPSPDGKFDPKRGVYIAQAGQHLKNGAYITTVYGKSLSKISYFAHA
jgi:hypothetical protein